MISFLFGLFWFFLILLVLCFDYSSEQALG